MKYRLKNWQCFEIDSKYFGRVRVFAGVLGKGLFQVTGDLAEFDPLTRTACTSLGNYYLLEGKAGLTPEALEQWRDLCKKNGRTGVADVTDEIKSSMEQP